MAQLRDPFGVTLARLRGDLRDGRVRPGEPLITTELAASLRVSATPVREALSRLVGEGLVDDRRGRGAYALHQSAVDIEDRLRLHGAYVDLALLIRRGRIRSGGPDTDMHAAESGSAGSIRTQTERLWTGLVVDADSLALARAHQKLSDQLALVRLAEPKVLGNVSQELFELNQLMEDRAAAPLQVAVTDYHRRRMAAARDLAAAVRDQFEP